MRMRNVRARLGKLTRLLSGAAALWLLLNCSLHAEEPPVMSKEESTKNCEQIDKAWLAIRACTALLNSAESGKSNRGRYYRSRGVAWLKEDEPKEALADFARALELDTTDLAALTGRARASAALGDHAGATSSWTLAIEQAGSATPKAHEASQAIGTMYLERGTASLAAGNTDAALADFGKILELDPNNTAAHIARGNAYFKLNDRARTLDAFDRAAKIDPSDIRPYMARAEAAERWGDTKLAIESYLMAATSNPRGAGHARQALKRLGVDKLP